MFAENAIGRFVSRRESGGRVTGRGRGGRERRMVECSEPIEETPRQLQFHDLRDKLAQTNFWRPASPCAASSHGISLVSSVFPSSSIKLIGKRDYSLHEFVSRKFIVTFCRLTLLVSAEINISKRTNSIISYFGWKSHIYSL